MKIVMFEYEFRHTSSPSLLNLGASTKAKLSSRSWAALLREVNTSVSPEVTLLTLAC